MNSGLFGTRFLGVLLWVFEPPGGAYKLSWELGLPAEFGVGEVVETRLRGGSLGVERGKDFVGDAGVFGGERRVDRASPTSAGAGSVQQT